MDMNSTYWKRASLMAIDIEKLAHCLENSIIKLNCIFKKRGVKVVLKVLPTVASYLKSLWGSCSNQYYK